MRALHRLWGYLRAMSQTKRNRLDLCAWLIRRPLVLAAVVGAEVSLLFSNRIDPRYKELALLKSAGMVSCEFCLDIGSALAHHGGITEQQIRDLPVYADSNAYTELEKLVLSFAEAITATPAVGEDLTEIREQLLGHFSKGQVAELAAEIAWENQRARLNQALGVRPTGMAEGQACALPELRAS